MKRISKVILLLILVSFGVSAQDDTPKVDPSTQTLTEQFRTFRDDAENYGSYKVLKATELNSFWGIVQDSLGVKDKSIQEGNVLSTDLSTTITGLETELGTTQVSLAESQAESSSISILGIMVVKQNFAIVFYIILVLLLATIGILAFLYSQSNSVTKRTIKDNDDLQVDIKEMRQKYMDREILLKRELQTERNLVEELKNKVIA
jgi:hypothetical protein